MFVLFIIEKKIVGLNFVNFYKLFDFLNEFIDFFDFLRILNEGCCNNVII